ncbi:4941_t:CDS:2 [Acaulospora morrowiae]|uniref:4941_t:CDS:1 n=1 Tax=Acaulospora morrowiae TaxID=94023 RepID=A0A9N9F5Q5_9GLOM|nr:4941_t:CDS:2 [Acaulospora morrowiae]
MNRGQRGNNAQSSVEPETLFCYGCGKDKPFYTFSKTQQTKALSNIYNPYAPKGRTTKRHHTLCKQCSPNQTSNLTCMICTKTKPLEKFSKAQRRNAEKARCLECMEKRSKEDELVNEELDTDDYEEDSDDGPLHETWDDIL